MTIARRDASVGAPILAPLFVRYFLLSAVRARYGLSTFGETVAPMVQQDWWRIYAGIVTGLILCAVVLAPRAASSEPAACWTPRQLQGSAEEALSRRAPPTHFIAAPPVAQTEIATIPPAWRGSIRRVKLPRGVKLVALTFDLCQSGNEIAGYDAGVIDMLRQEKVKATFFASGAWLADHRERAEQLLADPLFEVGSHSWTHRNLRLLDHDEVRADLTHALAADRATRQDLTHRACYAAGHAGMTKLKPQAALFRFPYGTCLKDSLDAVNDAGLLAIQWDVVSADPWALQTAERMVDTVVKGARSGSIIVMHANGRGRHTAEALPAIIAGLRARGFGFATVSEMLALGPPEVAESCYENRPGDNLRYDKLAKRTQSKPRGHPASGAGGGRAGAAGSPSPPTN
jgi:peptidoglycan/xylan/chitin deacetylase (PgdA/CDA1 family)